jgi:hypothetical protein
MPTLKPQAYASAIAGATRTFDAEDLAALFDLRDSHARYLWSSLAPGENQPDYVSSLIHRMNGRVKA